MNERLTQNCEHEIREHYEDMLYRPANFHTKIECYNKLGQLEDIEDKSRIDLIKIFKALKNGIWYKNYDDEKIKKMYILEIENSICWYDGRISIFEGIEYYFNWRDSLCTDEEKYINDYKSHPLYSRSFSVGYYNCKLIYIADYGRTWAFTREELEK